jgi:hypothetical protein
MNEGKAALAILDITGKGRQQAAGIAAGWFDFDHVCAKIRKPTCRIRRGNVTELDNPEVI